MDLVVELLGSVSIPNFGIRIFRIPRIFRILILAGKGSDDKKELLRSTLASSEEKLSLFGLSKRRFGSVLRKDRNVSHQTNGDINRFSKSNNCWFFLSSLNITHLDWWENTSFHSSEFWKPLLRPKSSVQNKFRRRKPPPPQRRPWNPIPSPLRCTRRRPRPLLPPRADYPIIFCPNLFSPNFYNLPQLYCARINFFPDIQVMVIYFDISIFLSCLHGL